MTFCWLSGAQRGAAQAVVVAGGGAAGGETRRVQASEVDPAPRAGCVASCGHLASESPDFLLCRCGDDIYYHSAVRSDWRGFLHWVPSTVPGGQKAPDEQKPLLPVRRGRSGEQVGFFRRAVLRIFTTYCTMVKETTKFLFTYKLRHRLKRLRFMLSVLAVGVCKSGTRFQGDHAHVREEFNKRSDCTNHLFELHCA